MGNYRLSYSWKKKSLLYNEIPSALSYPQITTCQNSWVKSLSFVLQDEKQYCLRWNIRLPVPFLIYFSTNDWERSPTTLAIFPQWHWVAWQGFNCHSSSIRSYSARGKLLPNGTLSPSIPFSLKAWRTRSSELMLSKTSSKMIACAHLRVGNFQLCRLPECILRKNRTQLFLHTC